MFGFFAAAVAHVIDGDTFRAEDYGPVRLWGINAPEYNEPLGAEAHMFLLEVVQGSDRTLYCMSMGRDSYERTVAKCVTYDGIDVACLLLSAGLAEEWTNYSGGFYRNRGCVPATGRDYDGQ